MGYMIAIYADRCVAAKRCLHHILRVVHGFYIRSTLLWLAPLEGGGMVRGMENACSALLEDLLSMAMEAGLGRELKYSL